MQMTSNIRYRLVVLHGLPCGVGPWYWWTTCGTWSSEATRSTAPISSRARGCSRRSPSRTPRRRPCGPTGAAGQSAQQERHSQPAAHGPPPRPPTEPRRPPLDTHVRSPAQAPTACVLLEHPPGDLDHGRGHAGGPASDSARERGQTFPGDLGDEVAVNSSIAPIKWKSSRPSGSRRPGLA
jgi:hypothetical protein